MKSVPCLLAVLVLALHALANDPGGGTNGVGANVTLTISGGNAILANGIITATIATNNAQVTSMLFNGTQVIDTSGRSIYYSMDGGTTYQNPTHCVYSVTTSNADMVDINNTNNISGAILLSQGTIKLGNSAATLGVSALQMSGGTFTLVNKVSLELGLFSPKPIYPDLEILTLADSLTYLATQLGADDPLVKKILAGKSPRDRAAELINGTQVRDVAFRKRLYEGGAAAVSAANDPMIELARLVDPESRALRKVSEEQDEVKQQAHAEIARARNAWPVPGAARYPDATGTVRLSFGTVKGCREDGRAVPAFTTFAGLYERAAEMKERPPFDLPSRWEKNRTRLNLKTPYNFVSTDDIIGGNSGSPVVNRAGEFVGIIFDGNLQSLPWDYAFDDRQGRAIAVDSAAILEGLDNIYGAKELVRELREGHLP